MNPRALIVPALMLVAPMARSAYADNWQIDGTFRVSPAAHRLSCSTYSRNGSLPLANLTATGPDTPEGPFNPPNAAQSHTVHGWTLDVDSVESRCTVTEWTLDYSLTLGWAIEQSTLCESVVPFAAIDLLAGQPVTVGHTASGDRVVWEIELLTPLSRVEQSPLSFPISTNYTHSAAGRMTVGMDIFAFLGAWFDGDMDADIDGSGAVTVQDIFAFLCDYLAP